MDKNKSYYVIGAIIILAIIGAFYYYDQATAPGSEADVVVGDTTQASDQLITARHQYKDGRHLIAGSVNLPTPCDLLNENVSIVKFKSPSEQATLEFTTINNSEICAQSIVPVRFKFDFVASEEAEIKATWNGQPVTLNLIPVGPNEDIEDYEVLVK